MDLLMLDTSNEPSEVMTYAVGNKWEGLLKANQPPPRDHPHMCYDYRHTDQNPILIMTLRPWEHMQMESAILIKDMNLHNNNIEIESPTCRDTDTAKYMISLLCYKLSSQPSNHQMLKYNRFFFYPLRHVSCNRSFMLYRATTSSECS